MHVHVCVLSLSVYLYSIALCSVCVRACVCVRVCVCVLFLESFYVIKMVTNTFPRSTLSVQFTELHIASLHENCS